MPWAAAAAAVGTIGSAVIGSSAAGKAADATEKAAGIATAEQRREFDIGQENLRPWLTTGSSALSKLGGLYGLDTYSLSPPNGAAGGAGTGTGGNGQPSQGQQAAMAEIRQRMQAWSQAVGPGSGAETVLQIINSGGSLAQVQSQLQSIRATTTNARNTAFLDPALQTATTAVQVNPGTYTPGTQQPAPGANPGATAGTPGSTPSQFDDFYKSPDYAFRLSEGLKGLEARFAAAGQSDSGALRKAEINYAGNLASGEFGTYANRLANLAGIGETTASQGATLGANYANQVGANARWAGDNQASSYTTAGGNYARSIYDLGQVASGVIQNSRNGGYASYDPNSGNWNPGPNGFPVTGWR